MEDIDEDSEHGHAGQLAPNCYARDAGDAAAKLVAELTGGSMCGGGLSLPEAFEPTRTMYTPIYVIERKTVPDLVASISGKAPKGGPGGGVSLNRLKDQKLRLDAFHRETGARPYLLVEGLHQVELVNGQYVSKYAGAKVIEGLPADSLRTALDNTSRRDGIYVQHERNLHEAARWINDLCKRCVEHQISNPHYANLQLHVGRGSLASHAQAISVRKADNLTAALGYRTWLMTARGMSADKAGAIMAKYGALSTLVHAYDEFRRRTETRKTPKQAERACELMLQDAEIVGGGRTPTGRARRLGPALSKAVYTRLFGLEQKAKEPGKPVAVAAVKRARAEETGDETDKKKKKKQKTTSSSAASSSQPAGAAFAGASKSLARPLV